MANISHITLPNGTTYDLPGGGSSTSVEGTLLSSGWSNAQQTITVQGVTATSNGVVGISTSATDAQRQAALDATIFLTGQSTNSMTFKYLGDEPNVNIPITVILMG